MTNDIFMVTLGRMVSACFTTAFISNYIQLPGLWGRNGLEPMHATMIRLVDQYDPPSVLQASPDVLLERFWKAPTLLFFSNWLGLTLDTAFSFLCVVGIALSTLQTFKREFSPLIFFLCWLLYLSIFIVGGTFLSFQWDILLLEAGWACIWAFPFFRDSEKPQRSILPGKLLLRFTLFKLMLMAGAVKVQADCPTWANLTATQVHFASQCIPAPLAWYLHQLPPIFHKLSVAATMWIELPGVVLLVLPFHTLANIGVALQIALQILILISGNYTFFNWLTIALCFSVLENPVTGKVAWDFQQFDNIGPIHFFSLQWARLQRKWLPARAQLAIFAIFVAVTCSYMFEISATPNSAAPWWSSWDIRMHATNMSKEGLGTALAAFLPPALMWTTASLGISMVLYFMDEVQGILPCRRRGTQPTSCCRSCLCPFRAAARVAMAVVVLGGIALTYSASVLPLLNLHPSLLHSGSTPSVVFDAYRITSPFRITSGYGLFRSMTGVGPIDTNNAWNVPVTQTDRPEVVLEGGWVPIAADGVKTVQIEWHEIPFLYKPGALDRRPPVVAPHQPRIDWQMWFAALGNYQSAPWFVHFADNLLSGVPETFALIDCINYPMVQKNATVKYRNHVSNVDLLVAPQFLRATLYHYDFSRYPLPWNNETDSSYNHSNWWSRTAVKEYLPLIPAGEASVAQFLEYHGWNRAKLPDPRTLQAESTLYIAQMQDRAIVGPHNSTHVCDTAAIAQLVHKYFRSFVPEPTDQAPAADAQDSGAAFEFPHAKAVRLAKDVQQFLKASKNAIRHFQRQTIVYILNTLLPSAGSAICRLLNAVENIFGLERLEATIPQSNDTPVGKFQDADIHPSPLVLIVEDTSSKLWLLLWASAIYVLLEFVTGVNESHVTSEPAVTATSAPERRHAITDFLTQGLDSEDANHAENQSSSTPQGMRKRKAAKGRNT
jgi:hypothetical protein